MTSNTRSGTPAKYARAKVIERGGGARDLATVPVDGGAIRTLVSGQFTLYRPLFSHDGKTVVFLRGQSAQRIHTADVSAMLRARTP